MPADSMWTRIVKAEKQEKSYISIEKSGRNLATCITIILKSHQTEQITLPVNIADIGVHHIVVHVFKTSKWHTTAKPETLKLVKATSE